jgi:hypothetical protein
MNDLSHRMNESTKRAIRAFILAPLVPPFVLFPFIFPKPWAYLGALPSFILFGAGITYLTALVVGVPAYWLLTQTSQVRRIHIFAVSGVAGAIAYPLAGWSAGLGAVLFGAGLGLSAGLAFWLLWREPAAQPGVADGRGSR